MINTAPQLPDYVQPVTRSFGASSRTLASTQTTAAERRVSLPADGEPIPICYGRMRLAPMIGPVAVSGSNLVVCAIWCVGEIEELEALYIDGEPAAGVTAVTYAGVGVSRSNLLTYSDQFDNAAWTKSYAAFPASVTVSANAATAPDGTITADKIIPSTDNTVHQMYQLKVLPALSTAHLGFIAKAAGYTKLRVWGNWSIGGTFDLSVGTVTGAGLQITALSDGWYLCGFTGTVPDDANRSYGVRILNDSGLESFAGDGTSGIYLVGARLNTGSTAGDYVPTEAAAVTVPAQGVDPTLAALINDYADDLIAHTPGGDVGIAYSVLTIPAPASSGWPRIEGIIKARKVYDPRTGLRAYSENFALHTADFLASPTVGMGQTIDWTSADAAADACDDAMSDGSARRSGAILIDRVADVHDHVETMRTYAGCLVVPGSDGIKLIPNRPVATSRSLDADDVMAGTLRLSRRKQGDVPTVVEVSYTDTSDWSDAVAVATHPRVTIGTLPRRVARVRLPGIQTHEQAYREAVERLNAASLSDLRAEWVTHDEGLQDDPGDVVELTHPIGLTAKKLRILQIEQQTHGRYAVTTEEYDEAVYSDLVVTAPTYTDTDLPSPLEPVPPSAVTLAEELYVDETGTTYSRLRVTWTGIDWPYAAAYRVEVDGTTVVLDTTITHRGTVLHQAVTAAVTQGVLYEARVWTVSTVGAVSDDPATATVTAQGKLLLPSDVQTVSGFEAGQFVALSWSQAIDIDLRGYEVRRIPEADYVGTSADWDHANTVVIVTRVDATSYLAFSQPVGDYRYGVKALDSIGQESANAAWVPVTVTADTAGTGATTLEAGTLTSMHEYSIDGVGTFAISSDGGTWADRFGATGTAWNVGATPGKLWAQEHSIAGGVTFDSAHWDTLVDRVANWAWSGSITAFGGAVPVRKILIATGADYPTMTEIAGTSANRSGRYMAARATEPASGADDVMLVTMPIQASRQGRPISQSETETLTVTQPLAVVFDTQYSEAPTVQLTVIGSAARLAAADNITVTGFDLYLWDTSGAAAAGSVTWEAYGS